VTVQPGGSDAGLDRVAEKGGKKLGMVVKTIADLKDSLAEVHQLRKRVREQGADFQLIVVSPPPEVAVDVEGLAEELQERLPKSEIDKIKGAAGATATVDVLIKGITHLEIGSVHVTRQGIRVGGTAVLDLTFSEWEDGLLEGVVPEDDYPLHFDVLLNNNLQIKEVYELRVDVSGFAA
jgi:hypothetical protein